MIIFVSAKRSYADSHFIEMSFYLSSALLNKLAKCFCSFFAEIMISPTFINSLFCYEDCFPHFRCHRYFWKKKNMWRSNDSWTALLETTLICSFIRLSFKFVGGKIFVFQTAVCFFFFDFNGFWRENDVTGVVIYRKFWESMTTQKQMWFFFSKAQLLSEIIEWNELMFLKVVTKWRVIKKSKLNNSSTNKSFHIFCYPVVLLKSYLFDTS